MVRQPKPCKTETEKSTSAGKQHVIPGAEKVSDAEVAKRKAREPLKPRSDRSRPTKACLAMRQTRPILSTSPPSLESLSRRGEPARLGCRGT